MGSFGLADLGASIGMDFFKMDFASDEAELARHHQREMYQNRYQMTVKDLKAAGLNPMLAFGSAPAAAAGPTASAPATTQYGISNAMLQNKQAEQVKQQTEMFKIEAKRKKLDLELSEKAIDTLSKRPNGQKYAYAAKIADMTGMNPTQAMLAMGLEETTKAGGYVDKFIGEVKNLIKDWRSKKLQFQAKAAGKLGVGKKKKKLTEKELIEMLDESIERFDDKKGLKLNRRMPSNSEQLRNLR